MPIVFDGPYQIFKVAGMGPYDNNGYVLADPSTREAYVVDAPAQVERLLDEAKDFRIKGVLITHTHPDHVAGYADLKRLTDLPVAVHEADVARLPGKPDMLLAHGDDLAIGLTKVRVMHTPGHTPGGICLWLDGTLISGDTLFPGGPGKTASATDFRQVVESITTKLHPLPEQTLVLPGHGADTTMAESKREYAVFAGKTHPEDLHDNVLWLIS
ncbi:MAG: MBL fold metallo-hydrolase [Chloroflexi bacterium]|nr:MBL fold metallo-hydrolase [Chloroflexota bacterium]